MTDSYDMFIETEIPQNDVIISRTDLKGVITYANDIFAEISDYSPEELIGKAHNILRHPDMPKSVYAQLWETIKAEKIWQGYVKNLRKDKGYYWVYAEVSGVYKDGELLEYKSIRSWVPKEKRVEMQKLYDMMRLNEEDNIRCVSYISSKLYKQIVSLSEKGRISPESFLEQLIKEK